ncbi:M20/M25/M40 family metallo-hydrolase [Geothermobacter hydrogeniphilus]|uniref:Peptidase M20 n=1 Tax=Geothermobacter hydrogeniphilus TaxID=1969733 RepID=A0A1X0YCX4_9BACT|nr:M20/M25/M40 family metallo-hydrolase [Geothermobacter hydrogeniphilus]ORJ62933.1 peptidase M20 [Geothermobacter hydrogeniphilus]
MINRKRLADEFMRMAAISSPSYREKGMADYLTARLEELGAVVTMDDAGQQVGGEVGNLVARLAGTRAGDPLLLTVHMDTVSPCEGVVPVFADGLFRSAGETVLGADDKAGIAELIEALEVVREQQIGHPELELVITICEEVGLVGAKCFDPAAIKSRRGYALDTNGVDRLIHRAPGANKLRLTLIGREAHAGIAPEKGISAIEVAAKAVARMPLGRIDADTTANIGTIHGGMATNIVARELVIEGEARSHDADKLEKQTAAMLACMDAAIAESEKEIDGETVRAVLKQEVLSDYPIMHVPRRSEVITLAEEAATALGRTLTVATAGGGSDANIFNRHGIETVILGTGMEKVHTVEEQVSLDDMVRVSELLVEILRRA